MPDSPIDQAVVRKVGKLSRIALSDAEVERFTLQLGKILDHVAQLNRLDTTGVPPMYHPLPISNCFRDDQVRPSLSPDEALANAPARDGDFFKVPKVLGEGGP
jgi:aspartyl-tRNA(Asn)/glutamyl-tRNA(Gln) amidotransferase subunit C